jgi:pyrroline-5-carboxylate reductase
MAKIGIVGVGNMGEAILKALLRSGLSEKEILCAEIKTGGAAAVEKAYHVRCTGKPEEIAGKVDFLLLAIKPQDAKKTIETLAPRINEKTVVISIMAGITTSNILSMIGRPAKIVRVMPNVCVKVGEGAMGITSNDIATETERAAVKDLFAPLGMVVEVGEDLMDAITALGASGPAFFLHFFEGMIDAGVKIGLPRDKSRAISLQVVKGTVGMLEKEVPHPTLLKEMITSAGGTTIAGLAVMEEGAVKGNIITAIERATKRAHELSS